jgi:anti-sigma factor RsiW
MSCNVQDILLYTEGELAPDEAARVRAHVAACAACRQLLLAEQALARSLGGLGDIETPENFAAATVSRARCDLTSAVACPRERWRAVAAVASLSAVSLLLLWPTGVIDAAFRSLAPLQCVSRFAFCWLSGSAMGALIVGRTLSSYALDRGRLPVGAALAALAVLLAVLVWMIGSYRAHAAGGRDPVR